MRPPPLPRPSAWRFQASTREGYVPRRRLSMRQITEVLRLNAQSLSYRQIAQSVGISASTVQSYLERAQRAGLSWPLPTDLDDAGIEARLFTRTEEELRPGRPEPDWLEVHRDHKRGKHVTLQLLHLEYKAVHPEGLSYTQFCVHYRRWRARQDVVMRLEYAAGERMFVDFAGDTEPGPRVMAGRACAGAGVLWRVVRAVVVDYVPSHIIRRPLVRHPADEA